VRHPYRIREIAARAGFSAATVDRVLHQRGGVRESTVREIHRAIADLDRERSPVRAGAPTSPAGAGGPMLPADAPGTTLPADAPGTTLPAGAGGPTSAGRAGGSTSAGRAGGPTSAGRAGGRTARARAVGRTCRIDLVVQAPPRFADACRAALEAAVPDLRTALIRPRFHLLARDADPVPVLARIGRSRSHGVILRAPDLPETGEAVGRLGIPVVTLATDLPSSKRVAHVGIDHAEAGATAAYLVEQWLADRAGDVLLVRGAGTDRGEDERAAGFRAETAPHRRLLEVVGDEDRAEAVAERTRVVLAAHPSVRAVCSLDPGAGGNAAVIGAFGAERRNFDVFVAYGLDAANAALLRSRRISAVLHHDLRADLRRACLAIRQARGELPGPIRVDPAAIQVITPCNAPPADF
jgi:LacI family transcriptional regulator